MASVAPEHRPGHADAPPRRGVRVAVKPLHLLWAILGLAPLVFLRGSFDPSNLPKAAVIQVGMLAVAALWLWRARTEDGAAGIPRMAFDLPLAGLLLWSGGSLAWAHS